MEHAAARVGAGHDVRLREHDYIIVGTMLERIGGSTWDELITERIFTPLDLRSVGLGEQPTC